jgi:NAD(P)-dependent dehydrogenase (short-subunit alcohol dehydrogenase family)
MSIMKNIFITGASSGFGKDTTQILVERGHNVLAGIRGGPKRGKEIFGALDPRIHLNFIDIELSESASLVPLCQKISQHFNGKIDVVINNAGSGLLGPLETQSLEQMHRLFEINYFSPLIIIQNLLPELRQSKGRIINVTSLCAYTVFPFYGSYSATKHALDAATEAMHYELKPFGIQSCSVEPGGYTTRFVASTEYGDRIGPYTSLYRDRITHFQAFLNYIQEKVRRDPQEVAHVIAKLCETNKMPIRIRISLEAHFNWLQKK